MIIEKTLRYVVLAGIFALPFIGFIVSSSMFFPFITGKNFSFRIIVEIMTGAWLALALVAPEYRPRRSWILAAFASYVGVLALSAAFGENPIRSFWSNYERMEGWVTIAHLFAYLTVAVSMMTTEKLWRNWWCVSLLASAGIGLFASLQLMGALTINQGGIRLDATLGNATYLGVYMLFNIFMAVFFLLKEGNEKWGVAEKVVVASAGLVWLVVSMGLLKGKPMFASAFGTEFVLVALGFALVYFAQKKYALIALILLDATMLFFSATRGAMLGLLGGAVLAAIVYIVLEPRSRFAWRVGVGVAVLTLLFGGLWVARDTSFVQNVTPLQRLTTISTSESTFTGRKLNWGMAWKGIQEKPLLGWGQENYGLVFNKYFDPGMYGQEPWFDRVHEILLDQLIAGGILGLIAYLLIHLTALVAVWSRAFSSLEKSLLTGLMGGYFFYLLFTFDNITSWILFVSLLGFIAVRTAQVHEKPIVVPAGGLSRTLMPVVAVVTLVATMGVVWGVNADSMAANKTLIQAVSPQQSGVQANLDAFKKAIAYNAPIGRQEIREHLVQGTTQLSRANVPLEMKKQFFDLATTEMIALEKEVPSEARYPLFLGMLYDAYQQYPEGKAALERALVASPSKQGIMYELGSNMLASGDVQGALGVFKKAFELAPENNEARSLYVAIAIQAKEWDLAKEIAQPLIDQDLAYGARVMNAYAGAKRFPEVIAIITGHLEKKPDDVQARFTLAAAHYLSGDKKTAIATLETLAKDVPETTVQVTELIKQIKDGTLKVGQQ